jgi:hypothetical protein
MHAGSGRYTFNFVSYTLPPQGGECECKKAWKRNEMVEDMGPPGDLFRIYGYRKQERPCARKAVGLDLRFEDTF